MLLKSNAKEQYVENAKPGVSMKQPGKNNRPGEPPSSYPISLFLSPKHAKTNACTPDMIFLSISYFKPQQFCRHPGPIALPRYT